MFEFAYASTTGGTTNGFVTFVPLLLVIVIMYFLMIRPQRKKDKEIQNMRNNLQVGDEIVTIGGICGKIVKTKENTIVVQVGVDKTKIEMQKWAVSSVTKKSNTHTEKAEEEVVEKKKLPKRLKKEEAVEEVKETVAEAVEEVVEVVEEAKEN